MRRDSARGYAGAPRKSLFLVGVKANNLYCRATSSITWAAHSMSCRTSASGAEMMLAFHRMEPAGAERHRREARRVSELARAHQTPYSSPLATLYSNKLRRVNLQTEPIEEYKAPSEETAWSRVKKAFGPIAVVGVVIAKFFAKLKFVLLPLLKFLPILLKSGGTMLLMIW